MKKSILFSIFLFFTANAIYGQPGANDPTFNPGDIGFGYGDGANNAVMSSAIQSDGKIIIGGSFTTYNGSEVYHITRLNTDGTLDSSFNSGFGANGEVTKVVLQADGKILISGSFTYYHGIARNKIARLNSDGTLDLTFDPGTGPSSLINTLALQSNGKIIIAGYFNSYNGIAVNRIARLNVDGTFDGTFDTGTGVDQVVYSIAIQNDDKIIIGGEFTLFNGINRYRVARLNIDGMLDTTFDPGGGANAAITTMAIQNDGKVIVAGGFIWLNGPNVNRVARLNTDGTVDTSFDSGTGPSSGLLRTVTVQVDGKIIIGGDFNSYNGTLVNRIAQLNEDGSIDGTFNLGTGASTSVMSIDLQVDGKIIIGGLFTSYNGTGRNHIARLHANGTLDASFYPGTGANSNIHCSALESGGKLIIGGEFTSYNGDSRNHITRLNIDGTSDPTFAPETETNAVVSTMAIQNDNKVVIGGEFTSVNGLAMNHIARLNNDGTLDAAFDIGSGTNFAIRTASIQNDGKIIIGGLFINYNGTSRNRIARLNTDGSLDLTFDPGTGADNFINTTAIQGDGKIIIGGGFTSYNGVIVSRIARLNTDGTLDATFNFGTGINSGIVTTAIQNDGKIIVGGGFTVFNGTLINRIVRLNSDGTLDTTFNSGTGANNTVTTIAIQSNGKIIIGGNFTSYDGVALNRVARLNTDGTLDLTFDSGTGANSSVFTTALQTDGKVIIGGQFTSYEGIGRNRIARLLTACVNTASTDIVEACDSYTWIDGATYSTSNNTATHLLTNAAGCDSLVTLDLTINYSNTSTDVIEACDSHTWIDGNNYTSSNSTATHLLTNATGCDSLVTLDLTINYSNTSTDVIEACDSHTWIDGNNYTTSNNTATHLLTNASGCDSLVTLDLTINYSNTSTDVIEACDSYTWIDGNNYTTSNNTATHLLTNATGCDSLVTLDLTINYSNTSTDVIEACDSYTWIDGNNYTASNNTATHLLTNAAGCDSLVTLDLTILAIDITVVNNANTLTVTEGGAIYQWLDCNNNNQAITGETAQSFTALANGSYAVEVSLNNCTETSACIDVSTVGLTDLNTKMNVYPNPTNNILIIEYENFEPFTFEIVNTLGQKTLSGQLASEKTIIDIRHLQPGLYLLRIGGDNANFFKIIKE